MVNDPNSAAYVELLGRLPFTVVNHHGRFTKNHRVIMDEWFKTIPEVGVFMGDLNDTVWPSTRGMKRWWHHALQDGDLTDPVYALHPQSHVPNVATKKGKRLDAILCSPLFWGVCQPTGYQVRTMASGGDHDAVIMHTTNPLYTSAATTPVQGSVRMWSRGKFQAFHRHMSRWAEQAEAQEGTVKRQEQIFTELSRLVEQQALPPKAMDPNEQRLKAAWENSPQSHRAAKDWCKYQALKRLRLANKGLRQLRKAAIHTGSKVFSESKLWLLTPFRMAQRQPEEQSARKLLPKFAGNPPWDPEQCKKILHEVVTRKTGFQTAPPSWETF